MRLAHVTRVNVCPGGAGGLSPGFQPWGLCTICQRGPVPRPRPSSIIQGSIAPQCKRNTGWKPMLLYAVASSLRVHGDSSSDGSERSLNSPETQCSIGFQPVFCRTVERCFFQVSAVPQSCVQSPAEPSPRLGIEAVCHDGGEMNGESKRWEFRSYHPKNGRGRRMPTRTRGSGTT
jgi:hypothetical protein